MRSALESLTGVFGEFLVDPSSAVMAPPDLAGQQFSGNGSTRNENFPQVPDLGPGGLWAEAQYPNPLVAFSMHGARSRLSRTICPVHPRWLVVVASQLMSLVKLTHQPYLAAVPFREPAGESSAVAF